MEKKDKLTKITNDTLADVQDVFELKLNHLKTKDAIEVIRRVACLIAPEEENNE